MSKSRQAESVGLKTQLYLVTPAVGDTGDFANTLRKALDAADIAAVLLRLEPADERTLTNRVKALAPIVQAKGAALLLDGNAVIAARGGADGAHLTGIETFLAAVDGLKPERIAGCGGLRTRHDAMTAGERGADYVLFGEPDDRRPPLAAVIERVEWWAEVFEIPCVGFAAGLDEVAPLVAAGADFIALGDCIWNDARGPAAALAAAANHLAAPESVA